MSICDRSFVVGGSGIVLLSEPSAIGSRSSPYSSDLVRGERSRSGTPFVHATLLLFRLKECQEGLDVGLYRYTTYRHITE